MATTISHRDAFEASEQERQRRTIEARAQARGHDWQATLEGLVDATSLNDVLDALVEICHAKAAHIAENWQDASLAKSWGKAGELIDHQRGHIHRVLPLLGG